MNRYQWQAESPIAQVEIRQDQAYKSAHILAADSADASLYAELPKQLRQHGFQVVADNVNGTPSLFVRNFKSDAQLLNALKHSGFTQGELQQTERHQAPIRSLGERFQDNSIIASGLTYLVADGLGFASGMVRGDKDGMRMGMAFASTSVLLTLFGTPDSNRQMENIYAKLDDFVKAEGIEDSLQQQQMLTGLKGNPESPIRKLSNFVSNHLVTINNLGQGVGGYYNFKAGRNQANPLKATAGGAIMTGQWGALLIPEDQTVGMNDEERGEFLAAERRGEKPQMKDVSPFANPMQWLQQRPLRLTGVCTVGHNMLTGGGGIWEFTKLLNGTALNAKQSKSGALMDIGAQIVNVAANSMYGMSSKDRRGSLKEHGYVDEITSVAAAIYADIPEQDRALKIGNFSGFLASMPEVKSTQEEVEKCVRDKIAALANNPWAHQPQAETSKDWVGKVANSNHTPSPDQAISF